MTTISEDPNEMSHLQASHLEYECSRLNLGCYSCAYGDISFKSSYLHEYFPV